MLNARELKVFYGVIQGLKGVDIDVYDREIVTLIGSNGAGKTSTLNGIVNLVRSSGRVSFLNDDISRSQTHQIVRRGLALVPEGRRVFTNLTIEENLRMALTIISPATPACAIACTPSFRGSRSGAIRWRAP